MSGCVLVNQVYATTNVPFYIPLAGNKYISGTFTFLAGQTSHNITTSLSLSNPTIIITSAVADAGVQSIYVSQYTSTGFTVYPESLGSLSVDSIYRYTILN
jgi:hypothetical protein